MEHSTVFILFGLWLICYASQSFKYSIFSVFFGFINFFPLVFKLYNQNPIIPILLNWVFWDCVGLFFCSLRTISGTNIFGVVSRDEDESLLSLSYSSFNYFWEVNLNQQILEDYISPNISQWLLKEWTRSRPSSPLQLGVSDPE